MYKQIRAYFGLLTDYIIREGHRSFAHIKEHCQHAKSKLDTEKIIRKNKNIDKSVVSAYERLEQELSKLGVEIKPTFNIEPPLGWNRTGCCNPNNQASSNT